MTLKASLPSGRAGAVVRVGNATPIVGMPAGKVGVRTPSVGEGGGGTVGSRVAVGAMTGVRTVAMRVSVGARLVV